MVTAGLVVAAWLLSSLMAGSASASTSSGQAETDDAAATTSSQQQGLLGGLLGGLTQTVGDVLGGSSTYESDSDSPPAADTSGDESSVDTTLPDLLTGISSVTGTASTAPAEPVRHQVSEPPAVKRESHAVATPKVTHKTHVVREHRATPKRATTTAPARPATKPSKGDADNQVGLPFPTAPSTPQAPPAPSTTISAGHDTTTHGKSWFLTTGGDATLTPPTATGTAIDHRATAVDRDQDRPATAPD
ncbi:hypothetical protein EV186_1011511 [Labedaea rhizosphaerae]|uniref:Uncharacterized protein n=1 Tax=Labedaea rhizosphaerae TaxID=598644 RepID=A0A4R6SNC0_LABRH|nr:hypothetical protein EV186_1011511 [Labedaea rhizosphaerae]